MSARQNSLYLQHKFQWALANARSVEHTSGEIPLNMEYAALYYLLGLILTVYENILGLSSYLTVRQSRTSKDFNNQTYFCRQFK